MDDRRILESYPLPLARAYRRFRNAGETRERHDAAYYLFEVYLKYAASIAIAHYLLGEERDHKVNAALKGLARPSLGEWARFLRECLRFLGGGKSPVPAVAALAALQEGKGARWGAAVELFNALRAFRTGTASTKEQVTLDLLLGEVVAYRNRVLGHGAPLGVEHYRRFGEQFSRAFEEVLRESPFLTALRLVSFDSVRVREGSRVECGVIEHMGLVPVRREAPHRLPYGAPAPREDALYLLGDEPSLVPLDPFLVAQEEDVYILNEAEGTPEYLSYATGQRYRPSRLGEAEGRLFERILGYKLDEGRLSRLGDDLVGSAEAAAGVGAARGAGAAGAGAAGTGAAGAGSAEAPGQERKRLGDFQIVREIGRGAMGVVFEALQESLGRRVALKVLPGAFALDARRIERFRREARATARIHHPNIVPVYEVGEAEGVHFYAMEFIEGTSLDRVIAEVRKECPEGVPRKGSSTSDPAYIAGAVEQFAGVAEGLGKAHAQGLVHRDVKPSNVLLDRGGRYVLVDFGLVHDTGAEALTRSGEMVGTLSYMSPEQVSRGKVDARSDVYSLGMTLYEALTLRVPFERGSDHETQRAILFAEPPPPRRLNPRVSRELETIILHALEKDPERRYPTGEALAADLRRCLRGEPIEARPRSAWEKAAWRVWRHKGKIAVAGLIAGLSLLAGVALWQRPIDPSLLDTVAILPFVNVGGDVDKEYLSAGITEVVLAGVSRLPQLTVISRSALLDKPGEEVDPRQVGRELQVEAVLSGRVVQSGDGLSVKSELLDVKSGEVVWRRAPYDRKLRDILEVEKEIIDGVAGSLRPGLLGPERERLSRQLTGSAAAHDLYLRGRYALSRYTEKEIQAAIGHFERVLEKDPQHASAYTGLADCYFNLGFDLLVLSRRPPGEVMPRAKEMAQKALEIDGDLAEAHKTLAHIQFHFDWDWASAEKGFQRALELDPNNAVTHHWYSHYLVAMERFDESLRASKKALELQPLDNALGMHLGWHYLSDRQYDRALEEYKKVFGRGAQIAGIHQHLGQVYALMGLYDDAIREFQTGATGDRAAPLAGLGHAYALAGRRPEAEGVLQKLDELAKVRYVSPYYQALVYTSLGEKDKAFVWLEKAREVRSSLLVYLKVSPEFDSLRGDPRLASLLERIGLPR